jgi:hypothetical protein
MSTHTMSTSHKSIETSAKVMLRELRDTQISPNTFFAYFALSTIDQTQDDPECINFVCV